MEKLVEETKKILGDNLLQILLYNDQDPHADDFLFIVKDQHFPKITSLNPVIKKMMLKKHPVPFIMTPEFILSSLDSYPLEFLNMRTDYQSLFGDKDYLENLNIEKEWVRLQVERELKGKSLLIRSQLLPVYDIHKYSEKIIIQSIFSLKPVLKGILFLLNCPIPKVYDEIIMSIETQLKFSLPAMKTAFAFAYGKDRLKNHNLMDYYSQYLSEIDYLIGQMENSND